VAKVHAELAALAPLARECIDASDKLRIALDDFAAYGERLQRVGADELDLMDVLLAGPPKFNRNAGVKGSWKCSKEEVHARLRAVSDAIDEVRRGVLDGCARRMGTALRHHTLEAAERRREAGTLEFHDLLVLARRVLRDPEQGPIVRAALHDRYQRLLLDEFQDTDPIQIELAMRIAAADPAGADEERWADVAVDPGRLFVVGDPKQSIYRFRRADISTFLAAEERLAPEAGGPVALQANFRTVGPVIDWVNHTFAALLGEAPDTDVPYPSQPRYVELLAQRGQPPVGPPVAVIGGEAHPSRAGADVVRTAESRDVANVIATALREGWTVHERAADGAEAWRPCRLGDITLLIPARTTLPFLEDALTAARIPYRAESSSLVYASRAVRDLLMVLRAADDPTDHLRIVSALRTPLLGCGDDDLFRHKVLESRTWSYNTPTPPDAEGSVAERGLAYLRSIHEARHWSSPAELLDRIARDRRALELGFAEGRPRDVWRRIRFVIDQARAWSEATGGSLRAYLHWVDQQTAEGSRVAESVLPETDDDAVRIMTIHAAKGLEFPITVVTGLSARFRGGRSPVEVYFPKDGGPVGYRMGAQVMTEDFEANIPIDEQMGYDERLRLLYVACTRAMDHLVVSLHREERKKPPDEKRKRTNAECLLHGMGELAAGLPDLSGEAEPLAADPAAVPAPPPDFGTWHAEREAAIATAARPGTVAATALTEEGAPTWVGPEELVLPALSPTPADDLPVQTSLFDEPPTPPRAPAEAWVGEDGDPGPVEPPVDPGLRKRPADLDLPPWLKGRYGTAVGRAVHGVLQTVDLVSGEGLEPAVAAQCQAEAVVDRRDDVAQLVQQALGAPSVQAAAGAQHWREVYACTPVGDRLLEGYIDLLYRAPEGLVVVDYKTAATAEPAELTQRVEGYRLQGAAYALAMAQATGEAVARVVFVFLTPQGAVERELPDLTGAIADVERLVVAGHELVTP
jgi:ATP-dependent helicase/nuclease subunit A